MCGFAGFLSSPDLGSRDSWPSILRSMGDAIRHRGPDDSGIWIDNDASVALVHRRLAILDLSSAGHQPMASASGRYVIVFNGEIYNHALLREKLEAARQAPVWCGHSDTETLLAGFDAWGIQNTVESTIGMFSFAVWDKQKRTLTLGRDRLGEKPLYYGWQGQGNDAVFLFGSELKALRVHPAFQGHIDRGALCLQLRHNYIPAPYSIYKGVAKLPPGCLLTVSLQHRNPKILVYWSGIQAVKAGLANPYNGSANDAVDELEALLKDAVGQQMVADVPLGAFLSGGIDSSTVVALMQKQSSQPVKTFTIGFDEPSHNEAVYAKAVAAHLGTDHTELYVTPRQAMEVIPYLPTLYDEPFSDSSQIPTFLVSQLTRQHVTVSLSGDGGDELFGGYGRYNQATTMNRRFCHLPISLRRWFGQGITKIPPTLWNLLFSPGMLLSPQRTVYWKSEETRTKWTEMLLCHSQGAFYRPFVSHWKDPAEIVIDGEEPPTRLTKTRLLPDSLSLYEYMMYLDTVSYLPDDILVKVDRAAMGVSLETRVPFLDHRVVEFAWRLPMSMKVRGETTKWPLRQVLYKHVPKELIDRPKMGFGVPIDAWLRGPLREWADELLDEARLKREGYFDASPIRTKWCEHLAGKCNWSNYLWDVLMFQAWHEQVN